MPEFTCWGGCSPGGFAPGWGVCSGGVSAPSGGVCSGRVCLLGGCLVQGVSVLGVSAPGGRGVSALGGGIPACTEADPPL